MFYALAAACALAALIADSLVVGLGTFVIGLLFAAIFFLTARLHKEAALILADIGASVVDANTRVSHEFAAGAE